MCDILLGHTSAFLKMIVLHNRVVCVLLNSHPFTPGIIIIKRMGSQIFQKSFGRLLHLLKIKLLQYILSYKVPVFYANYVNTWKQGCLCFIEFPPIHTFAWQVAAYFINFWSFHTKNQYQRSRRQSWYLNY